MDLYAVLNVASSASTGEIERAYRRLLRRYHPGINPGDRVAEDVYRRIQEAYAVLGDPARRRDHDQGAPPEAVTTFEATIAFEGFDFSRPAEGASAATFSEMFADVFHDAAKRVAAPERGADVQITLPLSFEDAVRGGDVPVSLLRQERCPSCAGLGGVSRPPAPCPQCQGSGVRRSARGHMVFTKECDACDGTGQLVRQTCRVCGGAGVQPRSEVATLTVPAGVDDGARLVVPGRGHAGAHGGPAGDLYATVSVRPHQFFRRDGRDILLTVPLGIDEAALGASVDVPTLQGMVALRVPPGTQSGARLRLKGRGVPAAPRSAATITATTTATARKDASAGDLIADVEIVLPQVTDERSKALLREFGRLNRVDARRQWFSEKS